MPAIKQILQYVNLTLLCLAALNTGIWSSAQIFHELHDHKSQVSFGDAFSDCGHTAHRGCFVCDIFSHIHPDGVGARRFIPAIHPMPSQMSAAVQNSPGNFETVSGWLVRAPPVSPA